MRRGAIGQIRRGAAGLRGRVRSLAHVLGQTVGRTFQASCDAALGDARCGVNADAPGFRGTGAVTALQSDRPSPPRDWARSRRAGSPPARSTGPAVSMPGGRRRCLAHDLAGGAAVLTLPEPPVRAIAVAAAFTIRAGCDKRIETCAAKFANVPNFRGFPHIPGQDAVLRYATKDGGHQGAVL